LKTTLEYMRVRVAGVLKHGDGLLLVKHRKEGRSYWLLPGGGVHLGETLKACLEREFLEELSIRIDAGELLFVVETASTRNERILQPTFRVSTSQIEALRVGNDRRVVDYDFFAVEALGGLVIYPDISDELQEYVRTERVIKKYVQKKWLD
jgi:8-oxo-dGTP diphosphatase